MTWIETIAFEPSSGKLRKLYDRVKGPENNVDNIMLAYSLGRIRSRKTLRERSMSLHSH